MRLVPAFRVSCLISQDTVALGSEMAGGLLLVTLSGVMIVLIEGNLRSQLVVSICPISLISLFLLDGGSLVFMIRAPHVIFGFQGP